MHFQRVFSQVFRTQYTIAAVVFGLVILTMVVAFGISWYLRRRGKSPFRRSENNPLEGGYLLALTGMAIFLIVFSFTSNSAFWTDPPPALTVRATGFQWCWNFSYAGDRVSVSAPCAGRGLPTLVLPAGRDVRIQVTSRDVLHAFWVPGLRVKTYAYPGHVNSFTIRLRQGRWIGHCSEFCGLYHYGMMFYIQAVPPAQFDRWLHAHGGPARAVQP
ncbi:MAG: cytochrome c oxidase subunit II [Actinobacteria bacterium]|nr:cytochrome c oxidase subunit II [Actinomycetota bacterium]